MRFEDMMNKEIYKSIILLTMIFQKRDKELMEQIIPNEPSNIPEGLRQGHYRYALVKNHDNMAGCFETHCGKFFNGKLERLYAESVIFRDRILSRNNLTNYLQKLVDQNILVRDKNQNPPTYTLSRKYYAELTKWLLKQKIDSWPAESVSYFNPELSFFSVNDIDSLPENYMDEITEELKPFILPGTRIDGAFRGLDFAEKCNEEEKSKIIESLSNIKKENAFLTKIRYDKTDENEGIALFAESYIDED